MTAAATTPREAPKRESVATRVLARVASRVLLPLVLATALAVVLVYAVFPTRTLLDQRAAITEREAELAEIESANAALEDRVKLLGTSAEIERLARKDHGLVKPGEEAYAVLPPAPAPVRLPEAWPFTELAHALDS